MYRSWAGVVTRGRPARGRSATESVLLCRLIKREIVCLCTLILIATWANDIPPVTIPIAWFRSSFVSRGMMKIFSLFLQIIEGEIIHM